MKIASRLLSRLHPYCSASPSGSYCPLRRYARNVPSKDITSKDPEVVRYLRRQIADKFSKLARMHDYRARSAFKLLEMNERFQIFRPGDMVLDVGSAPGSWCQVISSVVFPPESNKKVTIRTGYVLGVDLLPIEPIENVDLLCPADITNYFRLATHEEIRRRLKGRKLNAVLSDMAPKSTGDPKVDHHRIIELCRVTLRLIVSEKVLPLTSYGKYLCKIWDGPLKGEYMDELKKHFKSVRIVKPAASRENSAEIYLYAEGLRH